MPFAPEDYNALTDFGKAYLTANMRQWQQGGC
jgi:hypothetical protein